MPDLIPIIPFRIGGTEIESVDGRGLHANLGMGRQYGNWIKTWIRKANLIEHRDYEVFNVHVTNPTGGCPTVEYALTAPRVRPVRFLLVSATIVCAEMVLIAALWR